MQSEVTSLIFSSLGLVLGFIASYGQIKAFVVRALRSSSEWARRLVKSQDELARFYLDNPTVFIAYIANSFVWLFVLLIAVLIIRPATNLGVISVPEWAANTVSFVATTFSGLIIGSISSNCAAVKQVAKERTRAREPG